METPNLVHIYMDEKIHTVTNVKKCQIDNGMLFVHCEIESVTTGDDDMHEYITTHAFPLSKIDRITEEFEVDYLNTHLYNIVRMTDKRTT